jgi:hypothetical protein
MVRDARHAREEAFAAYRREFEYRHDLRRQTALMCCFDVRASFASFSEGSG